MLKSFLAAADHTSNNPCRLQCKSYGHFKFGIVTGNVDMSFCFTLCTCR